MPSAMYKATASDCGKAHERDDAESGDLLIYGMSPNGIFGMDSAAEKWGQCDILSHCPFCCHPPKFGGKKKEEKTMSAKKTMSNQVKWFIGTGVLVLAAIAVILVTQLGGGNSAGVGTYSLVVSVDNGAQKLYDKSLDIEPDATLLSAMEKHVPDIVVDKGMITSLCGTPQDAEQGKYWTYTVDGEFALVGAGEYVPKDGEEIVFDLHAFEE